MLIREILLMPVDYRTGLWAQMVLDIKSIGNRITTHVGNIARATQFAIILACATLFLLIAVSYTLRQAKRLPSSYHIEVVDVFGQIADVDGLRRDFQTHEAARSYAGFYGENYRTQFRFHVVGRT